MAKFQPHCPKCQRSMDRGHIPDIAYGAVRVSSWAPGDALRRRFFGGIKYRADQAIPLTAYRCRTCGYVELYAGPSKAR